MKTSEQSQQPLKLLPHGQKIKEFELSTKMTAELATFQNGESYICKNSFYSR